MLTKERQTKRSLDHYNKVAQSYDDIMNTARYNSTIKRLVRILASDVDPSAEVLDLGCGTGIEIETLLERFSVHSISGVDNSPEMLKICREKFDKINLLVGDFNEQDSICAFSGQNPVKLKSECYDFIISTGAVSEYGDMDTVVPWIYDLLKPGGIFANVGLKKNTFNLVSGMIWHFKPRSRTSFIESCRRSGFRDVQAVPIPWKLFPTNFLKYAIKAQK